MNVRNAALALAAVAAFGCSQPAEGPSAAEFNQSREALKARAERKKPGQPAAPAAQVAHASPQGQGGNLGGVEAGYVYDETGKRDPFRSFLLERSEKLAEREVRGPLEQFELAQLSLEGVVWKTGNARALIADPAGETYIVAEGARIGKNEGRVIAIEDNLVRVKETYIDYLGRETTKDIELRMRRNEGG